MLSSFLVTVPTAVRNKGNLRKEFTLAPSFRVQPTVPRSSQDQESKAAGHTVSAVRKNRMMNAGSLPASFCLEVQDGDAHRMRGWGGVPLLRISSSRWSLTGVS